MHEAVFRVKLVCLKQIFDTFHVPATGAAMFLVKLFQAAIFQKYLLYPSRHLLFPYHTCAFWSQDST